MNIIENNKQEIIKMYYEDKMSFGEIAKKLGVSKSGLSSLFKREGLELRKPGVDNRKYKINEEYFDNVDTPNKAYILGFLYADGYNNPITKSVILDLKADDKDILEKIAKEMESEMPLYFYSFVNKTDKVQRNQCRLIINSKHIHEKLIELGVVPNKTFVIDFPFWLSEELISHFIRGYFDGDGCFSYNGNRSFINICSSSQFCENMVNYLKENLNINLHINKLTKKDQRNSVIRTSNKEESKKFFKYIYHNADLKMDRKYNKVIEFFLKI